MFRFFVLNKRLIFLYFCIIFLGNGFQSWSMPEINDFVKITSMNIYKDVQDCNFIPGVSKMYPVSDSLIVLEKGNYWFKVNIQNKTSNLMFYITSSMKSRDVFIYNYFRKSLVACRVKSKKIFQRVNHLSISDNILLISPGQTECFYLHLKNDNKQIVSIKSFKVSRNNDFTSVSENIIYIGLKLFFFLFILLYVVFVYINRADSRILLFIAYLLCRIIFFLCTHYVFGTYLFPHYYNLNYSLRFLYGLGEVFLHLFMIKGLDKSIKTKDKRHKIKLASVKDQISTIKVHLFRIKFQGLSIMAVVNRLTNRSTLRIFLNILVLTHLMFVVISIFKYSVYIFYYNQVVPVLCLLCIFVILCCFNKLNNKEEKRFAIGYLIYWVTVVFSKLLKIYSYNNYYLPVEIGVVIELFIFSYVLSLFKAKLLIIENDKLKSTYNKLSQQVSYFRKILDERVELVDKTENTVEELFNIIHASNYEDTSGDNEKLKQYIHSVVDKGLVDKQWQEFDVLQNSILDGFLSKLTKTYPVLSNNELRICAMIKTGKSSKEIAELTSKTENSVAVIRSRIRGKINVPKSVSLFDFLMKI